MQTAIILTHDDLLELRQVVYAQYEAAREVCNKITLQGEPHRRLAVYTDLMSQLAAQLDDAISAIDTKSEAVPAIPAQQLSRIAKTLTGKVLVNGNPNITIGIIGNDLVITQP